MSHNSEGSRHFLKKKEAGEREIERAKEREGRREGKIRIMIDNNLDM